MATIKGHLSLEELDARLRGASDVREIRHIQAIRLLAKGHTYVETADILAFVPRWVEELAQRYNALGPGTLGDGRRKNGRKATLLTAAVLEALSERIKTPPDDNGLWSGPKVASWLARMLGRDHVHPQRGWDALKKIGWSIQVPRPRNPQAGTAEEREAFKKKLEDAVAEEARAHPDKPVEVWATDEHRLGLKPVQRRVWAPIGERPIALGHHRYEWLYVTAFVAPQTGETVWYLCDGVNKPLFEKLLATFAREVGAGRSRIVVLALDNAGWHGPQCLNVPDGIRLVYLPSYSPEFQPAECLWPLLDEPVANTFFDTIAELDNVVADRCLRINQNAIRARTNFHWWPKSHAPN